jgi:hypothetical protein
MSRWAERVLGVAALAGVVAVLLGCAGFQKGFQQGLQQAKKAAELAQVGVAYQQYQNVNGNKSPSQAADLQPFLTDPEAMAAVNGGQFVVVWNADVAAMSKAPAGAAGYVLAYESAAPTSGGLVLMGDQQVKQMSAAQFNAAQKAPTKAPGGK